ncbi:uncharacterized protein PHACADRAFT_259680 [Phanerochaete carnosa HHB-10118-sp]|uniref:J domain-containing protein n=1 Tax=Phanerochaete carnosa (strain HHB-10118-sp) TaxID=650164 RepID=K5UTT7_PHACS|nr:uncharacterized protein PHACADRAFT_259680 [Phanerochaete carnosa HHB-10118-sp]EKM53361.1 hypothetical protein PHACADRAFT_259680 [Phanerochaete carnosa HHB-10118-sp]
MLASQLLNIFHRFYAFALHRQPPPPNTPLYIKHRRYCYTLVVFGYALYTFSQAGSAIGQNLYEILGVPPTADEAAMKFNFRAFAKIWHPDKAGPHAETYFMEVRTAYEALKNPTTRFAYDRFGPQALKWDKVTTMQDYFMRGMGHSVLYYAVGIAALMFWNKIAPRDLAFWNYLILFWTFAVELLLIMAPSTSDSSHTALPSSLYTPPDAPSRTGLLGLLWPNRVAYQHINFLKSLSILLSSALYQVIPILFPSATEKLDPKQVAQFMSLANNALRNIDQEALTTIHTDLHACHGEPTKTAPSQVDFPNILPCDPAEPVMDLVRQEMEAVVLESILLGQQGEARKAVEAAVLRRRRVEDGRGSTSESLPRHQNISRRAPPRPLKVQGSVSDIGDESKYVRGRSLSL